MKRISIVLYFIVYAYGLSAQNTDSLEIINGPEKYRKEIIQIVQSYSKLLDSLRDDRFAKMSKDSLYAEKEMKNRPRKYSGYDGGNEGFLMAEEDKKIKSIINRFLKIDRISSSSTQKSGTSPVIYTFYYYRTEKTADGSSKSIHGKVIWIDKE